MRKPVWHFRGREGTCNLGLSYAETGAFPAVPVVGGKHRSGVVAQLQSLVPAGICPTSDSSVAALPYFGPVTELFSSRLGGEREGPTLDLSCTN